MLHAVRLRGPTAALLLAVACAPEAQVASGVVSCARGEPCPHGYSCVPFGGQLVCCQPGACVGGADAEVPDARVTGSIDAAAGTTDRPNAALDTGDGPAVVGPVDAPAADLRGDEPRPVPDAPVADRPSPDVGSDFPYRGQCPDIGKGPPLVWIATESFCIDSTEVTNDQYAIFVDETLNDKGATVQAQAPYCASWNKDFAPRTGKDEPPWPPALDRRGHPVVNVDWCDAFAFCRWAGKRLCGRLDRLGGGALPHGNNEPSGEFASAQDHRTSQWAHACSRAGMRKFPYVSDRAYKKGACNTGHATASYDHVVRAGSIATCQGGSDGLLDMSGNVEEWLDGCNGTSGPVDRCAVVGGSAWAEDLANVGPETSCDESSFAETRIQPNQLRGFRCCWSPP